MCNANKPPLEARPQPLAAVWDTPPAPAPKPASGSRRRRLWELDAHAHCPVVGVCLPIAQLRRLVVKVATGPVPDDDYALHCQAVTQAKSRTPAAEAIQRELDRRYATPLRQAAQARSTEALQSWWEEALARQDVAGPLWAVLTHARCTPVLEHRVLGDVHMLQHETGMTARSHLDRLASLAADKAELARELSAAQERHARSAAEHERRRDALQSLNLQLRAELIARDTAIAQLRDELQQLEAATPGLRSRVALGHEIHRQAERLQHTERALLQARHDAERQQRRADALADELARWRSRAMGPEHATDSQHATSADRAGHTAGPQPASSTAIEPHGTPPRLCDQAVLCVGGRAAAVPLYRHIVEKEGGRFLHHDGGEEDSSARLDATLAGADLVVCQTGCISHNAYWRVKDHCKRTGKPCVFVETPSTAGLKRALAQLRVGVATDQKEGARAAVRRAAEPEQF